MHALVASYDLAKERTDADRKKVRDAIWACGTWMELSESCYIIATELTPSEVIEQVKPLLDSNDRISIVTATRPLDTYDPKYGVPLSVWFAAYVDTSE